MEDNILRFFTESLMRAGYPGTIIAEREFNGRKGDRDCKVVLRIGTPFLDEAPSGSCWYWWYTITSPKGERAFRAAGLDSLPGAKTRNLNGRR
jgi:hypothetical protein